MHAFGIDRELCSEFLRKQCVIANLSKGIFQILKLYLHKLIKLYCIFTHIDQEKMLRDNINRMYKETAKWRT